jgi:DNA-binding NarL/FixJ family response regulator
MTHKPTRPVEKLTTRQRQVFDLIVLGLSNKEIGQILGLSANTVKIHIGKLFDKLGVRHRSAVALAGAKLGISHLHKSSTAFLDRGNEKLSGSFCRR